MALAGGSSVGLTELPEYANQNFIAGTSQQALFGFRMNTYNDSILKMQLSNMRLSCGPDAFFESATVKSGDKILGQFDFVTEEKSHTQIVNLSFGDSYLEPFEQIDYQIYVDVKQTKQLKAGLWHLSHFQFKELTTGKDLGSPSAEAFLIDQLPFIVSPDGDQSISQPSLDVEWNSVDTTTLESHSIENPDHFTPTDEKLAELAELEAKGWKIMDFETAYPEKIVVYRRRHLDFDISADDDVIIDDMLFKCTGYGAMGKVFRLLSGSEVKTFDYEKSADYNLIQNAIFTDLNLSIPAGSSQNFIFEADFSGDFYVDRETQCHLSAINAHQEANPDFWYYPKIGQPLELRIPESERAQPDSFIDVSSNDAHFSAIDYLRENRVIRGYPDRRFGGGTLLNRAELAKILTNARGLYDGGQQLIANYHAPDKCLSDVEPYQWYTGFVCRAFQEEWVDGHDDGRFKSSEGVKRAEAIKMIIEAHDLPLIHFGLGSPADWYSKYIPTAQELGLLYNDSNLSQPGEYIDRYEVSEMIYRTHQWLDEHKYDPIIETTDGFLEMVEALESQKGEGHEDRFYPSQWSSAAVASNLALKCEKENFVLLESTLEAIPQQFLMGINWKGIHFRDWLEKELFLVDLLIFEYQAFHVAVNSGCMDIAQEYLDEGVDINDPNGFAGKTPLFLAVERDDESMIQLLLDNGADPNMRTTEGEPLPYASQFTNHTVLSGMTPLLKAVIQQNANTVKMLLEAGAEPNLLVNSPLCQSLEQGCYVLDIAVLLGNQAVKQYLVDYGATLMVN